MKIIIATVQAPFVTGGAEYHAQGLKSALIQAGHEAEIVTIPLMVDPPDMVERSIIISRLVEIENTWVGESDLCIGLKFPAYYFPHSNKVLWVLHQHRAAYELFNTVPVNLKNNLTGLRIQKIVHNADNLYFKEAKRLYANSVNVADRMRKFNGIESTPLYHPCPDMGKFYCDNYDDYILMPSRINSSKRQMLALAALCKTKSKINIYIVGKADNKVERKVLDDFIKANSLQKRVRFFDFVTQEEKFKLYAGARAVIFIPNDEDYGYITLEAMSSSKAVITCSDSGGPLEFIDDKINGFVCTPDAHSIADAIDLLALSPTVAEKYGQNGRKKIVKMNITWEKVVKELTKT